LTNKKEQAHTQEGGLDVGIPVADINAAKLLPCFVIEKSVGYFLFR
jgi:hypothetical protein